MENKIIYQYPMEEQREVILNSYSHLVNLKHKKSKKLLILCAALLIATLVFIKISSLLSVITSIALLFSVCVLRKHNEFEHFLEITAYEDNVQFSYYSDNNRTVYIIPYEDIVSATIDENGYDNTVIVVKKEHHISCFSYDKNDNLIQKSCPECISFCLNPFSPEQGFFLYYAPKLFKFSSDRMKILNTFGNENDYFNSI